MSDVSAHLPARIERDLKDLERRIRIMERTDRLTNSSVKEGSLDVYDEDDSRRVIFGQLPDGENYGLATLDANGAVRFQADGRGLVAPSIPAVATISTATAYSTSSTSLVPAYFLTLPEVAHEGLELHVDWSIGGADTFKLSVSCASPLVGTTDEITATGPTSGTAVFRWLHGQTLGASPFGFSVLVRRTSGSGSISVFQPSAWRRSPDGCSVSGL